MAGIVDLTVSPNALLPPGLVNLAQPDQPRRQRSTTPRSGEKAEQAVRIWRERLDKFDSWEEATYGDINARDQEIRNAFANELTDRLSDDLSVNANWVYLFWFLLKAALSKANPEPFVDPTEARYVGQAKQANHALKYCMREIRMKDQVDKALDDALKTRRGGYLKIGYDSEFATEQTDVSEHGHQLSDDGRREVEHLPFVKRDFVSVRRIKGDRVKFDYTAEEPTEGRWIAFLSPQAMEDFKNDPRYIKSVRDEIVRTHNQNDTVEDLDALVWKAEVWDKATRQVYVFSLKGPQKWLREPRPWPFDLDGEFPLVHLKFVPDADHAYGVNPAEVFIDLMQANNVLLNNYLLKSTRTVPMTLVDETLLEEDVRAAIEDGEINAIVPTNGSPTGRAEAWPLQNFPMDERFMLATFFDLFKLLTGVDETRAGVQTSSNQTATEALLENQGSTARLKLWMDAFEGFWSAALRKSLLLIQQFWGPDRVFPIYDGEDPVDWTTWSDDLRNAEYGQVSVRAESTAPPSKQAKQSQAANLVAIITQFVPAIVNTQVVAEQSGILFDARIAIREALQYHDELDVDAMFPGIGMKQDPHQENQALLAGSQLEVLPMDSDPIHLPAHVRFRHELAMGAHDQELAARYGPVWQQAKEAIVGSLNNHIADHQGKMALNTPGTPEFQGMQMSLGGGQGGQAAGGRGQNGTLNGSNAATFANQNGAQSVQGASQALGRTGGAGGAESILNSFGG